MSKDYREDNKVPNIGLAAEQNSGLTRRLNLKRSLDALRAELDPSGRMDAVDQFEAQALNLLTSPAARTAFDLSREAESLRDRYGRNT